MLVRGLTGQQNRETSESPQSEHRMLEFLYTLQATREAMLTEGPTAEEASILTQHATYIERLAERGVVELAGRTQNSDETSFGIVVFRAESAAAAEQTMLDDPAVMRGVPRGSLFPYRVAYRGSSIARR